MLEQASAEQDLRHVPVGVVIGEDRRRQIGRGPACLQVARRREDRVERRVGVALAVVIGIDGPSAPRFGHELHPSDGAGR